MTQIRAFLVLLLAFSSICFGATLMQMSVAKPELHPLNARCRSVEQNCSCQELFKEYQKIAHKKAAAEIYKRAFALSFSDDFQKAKAASICASQLMNGSDHWRIEAKDLIQ